MKMSGDKLNGVSLEREEMRRFGTPWFYAMMIMAGLTGVGGLGIATRSSYSQSNMAADIEALKQQSSRLSERVAVLETTALAAAKELESINRKLDILIGWKQQEKKE